MPSGAIALLFHPVMCWPSPGKEDLDSRHIRRNLFLLYHGRQALEKEKRLAAVCKPLPRQRNIRMNWETPVDTGDRLSTETVNYKIFSHSYDTTIRSRRQ